MHTNRSTQKEILNKTESWKLADNGKLVLSLAQLNL